MRFGRSGRIGRSGELTGHRELALTLQESRVGRYRLLALCKTHQAKAMHRKLTDKLVSLYTGSNMISKIPSSEIFRPPHACSLHLPGCCCDGHGSTNVGECDLDSEECSGLGRRGRLWQKAANTYIDIANGDTSRHFGGCLWGFGGDDRVDRS